MSPGEVIPDSDEYFPLLPECRTCEGTGEIIGDDDLERTCPTCGGSGFVDEPDPEPDRGEFEE